MNKYPEKQGIFYYWWLAINAEDLTWESYLPENIFWSLSPKFRVGQITGIPGAGYYSKEDAIENLNKIINKENENA